MGFKIGFGTGFWFLSAVKTGLETRKSMKSWRKEMGAPAGRQIFVFSSRVAVVLVIRLFGSKINRLF